MAAFLNRVSDGVKMDDSTRAYQLAQHAIADLKSAILIVLTGPHAQGLTNAEIGRKLGIYSGHKGHEGHIPRTMLALMEAEGVVEQLPKTKQWRVRPDALAGEPEA